MKNFYVATMSNADLVTDEISAYDIAVLPIKYLDGKFYKEESVSDSRFYRRFYDRLRLGKKSRVKKPTKHDYDEFFDALVMQGKKNILYLATSSKMSTDYLFAKKSAMDTMIKFPQSNVLVLDTLSVGMQKGILALKACDMQEKYSLEEAYVTIKEQLLNECLFAIVYDSDYVKANSEVRGALAGGSFVGIKPILCVDGEGEMRVFKRCKGEKNAVMNVLKYAQDNGVDRSSFYVYSADNTRNELFATTMITEKFPGSSLKLGKAGMTNGMLYAPNALFIGFSAKRIAGEKPKPKKTYDDKVN